MSQKWMIAVTAALAIGAAFEGRVSAQEAGPSATELAVAAASESRVPVQEASAPTAEQAKPAVDFDQVFGDVEVLLSVDPEMTVAFRQKLYRAGLRMINAVPYEEWAQSRKEAHAEARVEPEN